MTYATGYQALVNHALDNAPLGVEFGPPDEPFDHSQTPSIAMYIRHGIAQTRSVGSPGANLVRYPGTIIFTIRVDAKNGKADLMQYADDLAAAFRNAKIGANFCQTPYLQDRVQETSQMSKNLVVPFYRDAFEG